MKIDPVFPSASVVNPPRFKFKPTSYRQPVDPVVEVAENSEAVSWPSDVKVMLVITGLLCLTILFS